MRAVTHILHPSLVMHQRCGPCGRTMSNKNINWGLSIILIVTLTTFLWTKTKEIKKSNFIYGKEFNKVRDSLGVPKIEANWISHESSDTYMYWAHPGRSVNTTEPMHLNKASTFDGGRLITEEDSFHYETNDSLAFRVIYKYRFDNAFWDCKFVRYRKGKYDATSSWKLTVNQADSVLNNWGLSR